MNIIIRSTLKFYSENIVTRQPLHGLFLVNLSFIERNIYILYIMYVCMYIFIILS